MGLVVTLRLAMPRRATSPPNAPLAVFYSLHDQPGVPEWTQSSSTSADDPHLLTAQTAHLPSYPFNDNETPGRDLSRGNETDHWVAESGASCHVPGDSTGMFDCTSPPAGKERLVIGDMTMMGIECFGSCLCWCTALVVTRA